MRTIIAALVLCSLGFAQSAADRSDESSDSVVGAAKKSREAKSATAKKVYTNEDLPKSGTVNVVGPAANNAPANYGAYTDPVRDQKAINSQWQSAINQQRARIAELERQLESAQQDKARSAHFYATKPNPNYEHYKQLVDSLTQQVEEAKKLLADVQEEAHKAGADKAYD